MTGTFSSLAQLAWRDRGLLGWTHERPPVIGYVGWVNRGNLGDEAIMGTYSQLLPNGLGMRPLPLHGPGRKLVSAVRGDWNVLLVGGGTLIGLDAWAERIDALVDMRPKARKVIIGAGVEDIEFGMSRGLVTLAGIEKWKRILSEFDFIGVRGPRSRDTLRRLDVDSVVVGDTVLGFRFDRNTPRTVSHRPVVAVNFTSVGTALSGTDRVRRHVSSACLSLSQKGYQIAAFGMDQGDLEVTRQLLREAGVRVSSCAATISSVSQLVQDCDLVIAERLHGAVFSSCLEIPYIHIGYKPKSFDFTDSVAGNSWILAPEASLTDVLGVIDSRLESGLSQRESDAARNLKEQFYGACSTELFGPMTIN